MDYKTLITQRTQQLKVILKKDKWKILLFISIIIILYIYYMYFHRRIDRRMRKLDPYINELEIRPITSCPKLIENGYLLCDFYVASSFRTFLPYCQTYDYSSLSMINKALLLGARFIELDVYNKDFCIETTPVVCVGKQPGNWHYTSKLLFKDCCGIIAQNAFTSVLSNSSDPFFLCLNLYLEDNLQTMNKISNIIRSMLGDWLLDSRYSYSRVNIAQVPISEFLNKLVIITNNKCKGSKLAELVNYTWFQPFLRNYSSLEITDLAEPKELTDFNRKNITRVYPNITDRDTKNYNPRACWMYGCQFVSMNYQLMDRNMLIYLKKFKKSSFILKPYKLRFQPSYYNSPTPQTKKVSFAPEQISTPYYSITY